MDRLEFQPTQKTPYVLLDPNGKIKFRGRSIPEDVSLFYEDILDWIIAFASSPPSFTEVDIELEYLNSGTSKYMLRLLKKLKEVDNDGYDLKINWVYEEGDDDSDTPLFSLVQLFRFFLLSTERWTEIAIEAIKEV